MKIRKTNKGGMDSRFNRGSSKRTRSRVERRQVVDKRTSVERRKILEQLNKVFRVIQSFMSLGKPKYVLWNLVIKYNPSLEKPKRTKSDFLKMANVLNTLLSIAI